MDAGAVPYAYYGSDARPPPAAGAPAPHTGAGAPHTGAPAPHTGAPAPVAAPVPAPPSPSHTRPPPPPAPMPRPTAPALAPAPPAYVGGGAPYGAPRVPRPDSSVPVAAQSGPTPTVYLATYSSVPVYEITVRGIALMRRRSDGYLNATQILKIAGIEKARRTRILEREILTGEHDKVQGGYGTFQGTWIPLYRAQELAMNYSVYHLIRPLLDFDPSATRAPAAPYVAKKRAPPSDVPGAHPSPGARHAPLQPRFLTLRPPPSAPLLAGGLVQPPDAPGAAADRKSVV